jgi:hypothetical protein
MGYNGGLHFVFNLLRAYSKTPNASTGHNPAADVVRLERV